MGYIYLNEGHFTPQSLKKEWFTEPQEMCFSSGPLRIESTLTLGPQRRSASIQYPSNKILSSTYSQAYHLGPIGPNWSPFWDRLGGLKYSDFSCINKASLNCVYVQPNSDLWRLQCQLMCNVWTKSILSRRVLGTFLRAMYNDPFTPGWDRG